MAIEIRARKVPVNYQKMDPKAITAKTAFFIICTAD